jgi:hypothetical protein
LSCASGRSHRATSSPSFNRATASGANSIICACAEAAPHQNHALSGDKRVAQREAFQRWASAFASSHFSEGVRPFLKRERGQTPFSRIFSIAGRGQTAVKIRARVALEMFLLCTICAPWPVLGRAASRFCVGPREALDVARGLRPGRRCSAFAPKCPEMPTNDDKCVPLSPLPPPSHGRGCACTKTGRALRPAPLSKRNVSVRLTDGAGSASRRRRRD